jgi:hypothetical protein
MDDGKQRRWYRTPYAQAVGELKRVKESGVEQWLRHQGLQEQRMQLEKLLHS